MLDNDEKERRGRGRRKVEGGRKKEGVEEGLETGWIEVRLKHMAFHYPTNYTNAPRRGIEPLRRLSHAKKEAIDSRSRTELGILTRVFRTVQACTTVRLDPVSYHPNTLQYSWERLGTE